MGLTEQVDGGLCAVGAGPGMGDGLGGRSWSLLLTFGVGSEAEKN